MRLNKILDKLNKKLFSAPLPEGISEFDIVKIQFSQFIDREKIAIWSSLFGIGPLVAILLPLNSNLLLSIFVILRLSSLLHNYIICLRVRKKGLTQSFNSQLYSRLGWGVMASGMTWGLFIWILPLQINLNYTNLFVMLILLIIVNFAVISTSLIIRYLVSFMFGFALTTIPYLYFLESNHFIFFFILECTYIIVLSMYGLNLNLQSREILAANLFNKILSARLTKSNKRLEMALEKSNQLALHDELTGALNRRAFEIRANQEILSSKRHLKSGYLIMFDLDYFKKVNDEFGHLIGDSVLKNITKTVQRHLRQADIFARWGGEEFLLYLPRTQREEAIVITNRLRLEFTKLKNQNWPTELSITASFGLAELKANSEFYAILNEADQALYQAKKRGRNQLYIAKTNLT